MSGKRRKQQRSRGRAPVGLRPTPQTPAVSEPGTDDSSPATPSPAASAPARPVAAARYASNVSGPRRGAVATASTGTIDIDERVPYFSKDLRRIVITAVIMVALIIGGSLLLH